MHMFSSTRVLSEMMMMMKSISTEIFFYRTVSKNWPIVIFPSVNSIFFFYKIFFFYFDIPSVCIGVGIYSFYKA